MSVCGAASSFVKPKWVHDSTEPAWFLFAEAPQIFSGSSVYIGS